MKNIAKALLQAQSEMGNAKKDSTNPFFKSKYADLNSIREACIPILNDKNIVVLQPMIVIDGKNYIKTLLLHDSGESLEGLTEIIYSKQNDAQSQGSGVTYARRYGLQSLVNIGADDDDGASASAPVKKAATPKKATKATPQKAAPKPNLTKEVFDRVIVGSKEEIESTLKAYKMSEASELKLNKALKAYEC